VENFGVDVDLSEFFSTISQEKKKKNTEFKSIVGEVDLNSVFEEVSTLKKKNNIKNKVEKKTLSKIETLLNSKEEKIKEESSIKEPIKNILIEKSLGLLSEPSDTKHKNDPITPLDQKFATLEDLNKHYNLFLSRIQQQLSTLGGGGETNLTYMDVPITSVTTSSYTIKPQDYYIGVNYAGAVTITLPRADREGKVFVVKDELGEASKGTNRYITVLPTGSDLIDGRDRAILAFDYGSLTFIWKGNSWRVV
jgi:hypothetical protein